MTRKLFSVLVAGAIALMSTIVIASQQGPLKSDVSGNWSGTIAIPEKGKASKTPLHVTLKQSGAELTGTVGPEPNAQLPITRGHVESTKFGTVVTFSMPGQGFVMHFELRPDSSFLRGVARLEGQPGKAPVELEAVK